VKDLGVAVVGLATWGAKSPNASRWEECAMVQGREMLRALVVAEEEEMWLQQETLLVSVKSELEGAWRRCGHPALRVVPGGCNWSI
jgi:hypothetical protein